MSRELDRLRRWEGAGGTWLVRARGSGWVELTLLSCDRGEEMDRLRSADLALIDYVGSVEAAAEAAPSPGGAPNA